MNTQQYEGRSLFIQAAVGVLGLIAVGLVGYIAQSVVETKEVVVRIEERQSVIADGFRSLEGRFADQRSRIQDHEYRLRALERDEPVNPVR